MDDTDTVATARTRLSALLARPDLEPRHGRRDWDGEAVDEVRRLLSDELLPAADASASTPGGGGRDPALAEALCSAAPLLHESGHPEEAKNLVKRARAIVHDGTDKRVLDEALWSMDRFARLGHARWLLAQGREAEARDVARPLAGDRAAPGIAEAARAIADRPAPLSRAPSLMTFNGCGVSIYGSRDRRGDGSYVTTRYLVVLFVPILPLDAYRVIPAGGRRYLFLSKVPLAPGARVWRRLLAAAVVVALAGWGAITWWHSPSRRLHAALESARAAENAAHNAGSRAQVEQRYEKIVDDYSSRVPPAKLEPAAEGIARLLTAQVPSRLTPANVGIALTALRRFQALPVALRGGAAARTIAADVVKWGSGLSSSDDAALSTSLELFDAGARSLEGAPAASLVARRDATTLRFAKRIAPTWPLAALRLYGTLPAKPQALRGVAAVIRTLGDDPSVWVELEPTLRAWQKGVRSAKLADLAALASSTAQRIAKAHSELEAPERKALIDSKDEKKLAAAAQAHPHDQGIGVARAALVRAKGDAKGAIAILTALGPPGLLTTHAALMLAGAESDVSRYADAEALLSHMLAQRMPAYESARERFEDRSSHVAERLVEEARNGTLPQNLSDRLEQVDKKDVPSEFHKIVSEELDSDPELARLRTRLAAVSDVVPIAIRLGTIQLRHASETGGKSRRRLLADAERTFLSIQASAEGLPFFHLGLGQVYYRLGKTAEGDKEFGQLLEGKDVEMHLQVARAYRALGKVTRARAIARGIYRSAPEAERHAAAALMALTSAGDDEEEKWLKRADPESSFVRTSLLEVEARRLVDSGDRTKSADKFLEAARAYENDAKHDTSAANNAALDYAQRYLCTGDKGDLDAAINLLDGALSLEPDDALAINNEVPLLMYRAELATLSSWLRERTLRLSQGESELLLAAMLDGPHRKEIVDGLTGNKDYVRGHRLLEQAMVLAPAMPDAWQIELGTFSVLKDVNGLKSLESRVRKVPTLDLGRDEDAMHEWLSGVHDEKRKRQLKTRVAQLESARKALDGKRDAASVAAIDVLEADKRDDLAVIDDSAAEADAAVSALRTADSTWADIGARPILVRELLRLGLLRTAASTPAVGKVVKSDLRELGSTLVIQELLESRSRAALGALARDPAFAEAAKDREALAQTDPAPEDWVLAALVHDKKLADLARPAFNDPVARITAEVEPLVWPGKQARLWLAMVRRGPKTY